MERFLLLLGLILLAASRTRADGETDAAPGERTEPVEEPAETLAKMLERHRYLKEAKAELLAQIRDGEETPEEKEALKATLRAMIAEHKQLIADFRELKAEQLHKGGKPASKGAGKPGEKEPPKAPPAETGKAKEPKAPKSPEVKMVAETIIKREARYEDRNGIEELRRRFFPKRPRAPPAPRPPKAYRPPASRPPKGYRPPAPRPPKGYRPPAPRPPKGYRPPAPSPPKAYRPPAPRPPKGYRPPASSPPKGYRPPAPRPPKAYRPPAPRPPKAYRPPAPKGGGY